jgi:hypothetical protein
MNRVRICAPVWSKKSHDEDIGHETHSLSSYDMPLFVFVKACYTLDGHIIRFCGPGRKNDVLRIGTNQVGNMLTRFVSQEMWRVKNLWRTFLASSTPFSASHPYACVRLCGFPYWSVK